MSSSELLMLFLFVIIVFSVLCGKMHSDIIIGALSLWFTILWISWDNMGLWDNSPLTNKISCLLKTCGLKPNKSKRYKIKKKVKFANNEIIPDKDYLEEKIIETLVDSKTDKDKKPPVKKLLPDSSRVAPLEYSENNYKKNNFPELGSLGDNRLMQQMKHMSNKNRQSVDGAARFDKYTNIGYFANELDQAANSRWWDDDTLEKEF
jgi:hypothetical protein